MLSVIFTEAAGKNQTGKMGVRNGVPSVPWGSRHPWWVKTFQSAAMESPMSPEKREAAARALDGKEQTVPQQGADSKGMPASHEASRPGIQLCKREEGTGK